MKLLDIVKLTVLELVGLLVAVILMVIVIRLYYVWFTRIRQEYLVPILIGILIVNFSLKQLLMEIT